MAKTQMVAIQDVQKMIDAAVKAALKGSKPQKQDDPSEIVIDTFRAKDGELVKCVFAKKGQFKKALFAVDGIAKDIVKERIDDLVALVETL